MKKGIVLIIVIGVMLVIFTLAYIALYLMSQESRIAEHKIRRLRAYYAAQAGIVHALEKLRRDQYPGLTPTTITSETISVGNIGDQGYPIKVRIVIGAVITDVSKGELINTRPVAAYVQYR